MTASNLFTDKLFKKTELDVKNHNFIKMTIMLQWRECKYGTHYSGSVQQRIWRQIISIFFSNHFTCQKTDFQSLNLEKKVQHVKKLSSEPLPEFSIAYQVSLFFYLYVHFHLSANGLLSLTFTPECQIKWWRIFTNKKEHTCEEQWLKYCSYIHARETARYFKYTSHRLWTNGKITKYQILSTRGEQSKEIRTPLY